MSVKGQMETFQNLIGEFRTYSPRFCRELRLVDPSEEQSWQQSIAYAGAVKFVSYGSVYVPDFRKYSRQFRCSPMEVIKGFEAMRGPESISPDLGDHIMKEPCRAYTAGCFINPNVPEEAREASRFSVLCHTAGTKMPGTFWSKVPFVGPGQMRGLKSVDRFLNLMFWAAPPHEKEIAWLLEYGAIPWYPDQYAAAADTIEECGLATEAPTTIRRNVYWPSWAGQRPVLDMTHPSLKPVIGEPAVADSVSLSPNTDSQTGTVAENEPQIENSGTPRLSPTRSELQAHLALQYAETKNLSEFKNLKKAYAWLEEYFDSRSDDIPPVLQGYELPIETSWKRQVGAYRTKTGTQVNSKRPGRSSSKSVVKNDEL